MLARIHDFHIPVMGLAFTIDTPIRVAHLGISSVISIMDDDLIERMNGFYSLKYGLPHREITTKDPDYRAARITSYLNLVQKIVNLRFAAFKDEIMASADAMSRFLDMLPGRSTFKSGLADAIATHSTDAISQYLDQNFAPGSADVNIMTKVDRENFDKSGQLPAIFNDAHAALRGFANSDLQSSVVLSAGMHPRLYSYFEEFEDFFPTDSLHLKKKIIIKVSDYRSAQVQGMFLAKKGLWVSEFRIESGLNCGGHAFATDGLLMGPILEEFKRNRATLQASMHEVYVQALSRKGLAAPPSPLPVGITVQGGVGTAGEHRFLLDYYQVDSVGWGSPFLLVPEATSLDQNTRDLLANAQEADLYTSNLSPLGVPFNTVRGTSSEQERLGRISAGKPGSSCPKKYLALNKEFGAEGMCTAARKFQNKKIKALEAQHGTLTREMTDEVHEKSCLCVGLANSALLEQGLPIKGDRSVVICPGPNIAYFTREYSLREMVGHIYGREAVLTGKRPHMFLKELHLYISHLAGLAAVPGSEKAVDKMSRNLEEGIAYYRQLFSKFPHLGAQPLAEISGLDALSRRLGRMVAAHSES